MKEFPPFRLDVADQSLWRGNQRVPLTPKAFAVLNYLVERAGRLVTQNELLEALWPDTFVQPEVLKSQILDVRTALGDRPKDPLFIETVPRRGYRFIAPVTDRTVLQQPREPDPEPELPPSTLVGRDNALADLRNCCKKAAKGERQIVFITGEQGMGKTTVVEAFLQELNAKDTLVARGQCLEGYGVAKEPYYPVLEAVGQLSRGARSQLLASTLESYAPTWLIQLPALLKQEHRQTLQRELLGATRERMIREMCEALESLTAERTLVLLFEDLHWSDHATVDLITAIAYRRSSAKLLLIGTYRPVDLVVTQHPLKQASYSLKAHRLSKEIALSPLGEDDVARYLSRHTGRADDDHGDLQLLARWLRKQTEGNPLFMVTVVEHLLELRFVALDNSEWTVNAPLDQIELSVPDTLRQMVDVQIERLSPREQLTLEAASVHGTLFSAALTGVVLDFSAESVEDTCHTLAQQHHFIRTADAEQLAGGTLSQQYEFLHAVFRGVFYHRLPPARRAKLHRRFGEAIEARYPNDRSPVAAELAGHFEQCADWPRAIDYLWLAARNAWLKFDYREAVSILEHALDITGKLDEPGRSQLEARALERLAVLQQGWHSPSQVIATLQSLVTRASASGITELEVRGLVMLATFKASEDSRACLPLIERVQALVAQQTDPFEQAQTRALCSSLRISLFGWNAELVKEGEAALAQVKSGPDVLAAASLVTDHCFNLWASSQYSACVRNVQQSLPALLASGRVIRFLQSRDLMALSLAFLGHWGQALDTYDQGLNEARKNDAPMRLVMPLLFKAWVHFQAMDFNGALEICSTLLPSLNPVSMRDRRWIVMQIAASSELGIGQSNTALERLEALKDEMDVLPVMLSWYWRMPLQLQLTEGYLRRSDWIRARKEADMAVELTGRTEARTWQALAWEASARLALLEGDEARAKRDLQNALQAMQGFDVPLAAWRVHATAAETHRRNGDTEAERHHLAQSSAVINALAGSLDTRPALQKVFLSAPVVSELLERSQKWSATTA